MTAIEVTIEAVDGKAFASALDWPGWSRAAKTPELAVERLLEYAERYRPVAALAGSPLAVKLSANVVETSHVVLMRMGKYDRVEMHHFFPKHLVTEVGTRIYHQRGRRRADEKTRS